MDGVLSWEELHADGLSAKEAAAARGVSLSAAHKWSQKSGKSWSKRLPEEQCELCSHHGTTCSESRPAPLDGTASRTIRRRRECEHGRRWTTYEVTADQIAEIVEARSKSVAILAQRIIDIVGEAAE